MKIRRGIFQRDRLSPLIFSIVIDPLRKVLREYNKGYDLSGSRKKKKINHLLFMGNLKIYAESDEKLNKLVKAVFNYTQGILYYVSITIF